MKKPLVVLVTLLTAWSVSASAASRAKQSSQSGRGSKAALPPKWGKMIQPLSPEAAAPAPAKGLLTTELGARDLSFFTTAVQGGREQIWLCQTAKERAETDQVKAVGDALEVTQAQENTYITRLAATKGITVEAGSMPLPQGKISAELVSLKGPAFDKAVMDHILAAAQETVTSYESAAQSSDAEIRSLAERLLPVAKDKFMLASRIATHGQEPLMVKPQFRTRTPAAPRETTDPGATPAVKTEASVPMPDSSPAVAKIPPRPEGPKPIGAPAPIAAPPAGTALPAATVPAKAGAPAATKLPQH